jgi:hypothetical protein
MRAPTYTRRLHLRIIIPRALARAPGFSETIRALLLRQLRRAATPEETGPIGFAVELQSAPWTLVKPMRSPSHILQWNAIN